MIRQTVFGFKIEKTEDSLTAHGGLALLAEYNHGMGLRDLADRYLPGSGSNRGYAASAFVGSLVLLLQAGGRRWKTFGKCGGRLRCSSWWDEMRFPTAIP